MSDFLFGRCLWHLAKSPTKNFIIEIGLLHGIAGSLLFGGLFIDYLPFSYPPLIFFRPEAPGDFAAAAQISAHGALRLALPQSLFKGEKFRSPVILAGSLVHFAFAAALLAAAFRMKHADKLEAFIMENPLRQGENEEKQKNKKKR